MLRFTLVAVALACACSSETVPGRDAAPEKDPLPENPVPENPLPENPTPDNPLPEEEPTEPPVGAFDVRECENMPTVDYFKMIPWPPEPPIFSYADTSCGKKPPSVLVVNATKKTVRVEGVAMAPAIVDSDSPADESAKFTASTRSLPRDLGPEEAMATEIAFWTRVPETTAVGDVVVKTPEGCQTVGQVRGIRHGVEVGVGLLPLVIDFGVLKPGEAGPIIDVEFIYRVAAGASDIVHLSVDGTMPSDVFRLVERVSRDLPEACERIVFPMQMTAPTTPGPVDGKLFLEIGTSTEGGIGTIALRGLVRE